MHSLNMKKENQPWRNKILPGFQYGVSKGEITMSSSVVLTYGEACERDDQDDEKIQQVIHVLVDHVWIKLKDFKNDQNQNH